MGSPIGIAGQGGGAQAHQGAQGGRVAGLAVKAPTVGAREMWSALRAGAHSGLLTAARAA